MQGWNALGTSFELYIIISITLCTSKLSEKNT